MRSLIDILDLSVEELDELIATACDIIAEAVSDNADYRRDIRALTFDNGTATVNTETCEALGMDFAQISEIFAPLCTKVQSIVTAESFEDLAK